MDRYCEIVMQEEEKVRYTSEERDESKIVYQVSEEDNHSYIKKRDNSRITEGGIQPVSILDENIYAYDP